MKYYTSQLYINSAQQLIKSQKGSNFKDFLGNYKKLDFTILGIFILGTLGRQEKPTCQAGLILNSRNFFLLIVLKNVWSVEKNNF